MDTSLQVILCNGLNHTGGIDPLTISDGVVCPAMMNFELTASRKFIIARHQDQIILAIGPWDYRYRHREIKEWLISIGVIPNVMREGSNHQSDEMFFGGGKITFSFYRS